MALPPGGILIVHDPNSSQAKPHTVELTDSTAEVRSDEYEFLVQDPSQDYFENLGRYKIHSEIARGGMGVIFRAYDEVLHRDVAIKLLQHQFKEKTVYHQRFVNEALLTSRLQHPCIIPIYDCGHADDQRPYFAMKLITGKSLGSILAVPPKNQLDRSRLFKIFEQVCQAVSYAHSFGVLHLDVKPSNIMVGEFGEVHVMDWGLARMWPPSNSAPLEQQNGKYACNTNVLGTAAYMAPEQARGEAVCPRTDVFGLGALLCEILTGRPPYRGRDYRGIYASALQGKLDEATDRLDACDGDACLIELAKRCLATNRKDRPESAEEIARAIANYLESALEQAESDLCRFFDLSLDLFCIATQDGYFQRVNSNFPRVLGYSKETLISQPFLDLVHEDDVKQTELVMSHLRVGKPVVQFCNRYRHADGHYVMLEWTAQSIPDEGIIFAVARDVSSRSS